MATQTPDHAPTGQILVVTLGGSVAFYVVEHNQKVIRDLVDFLQRSDFAGVILTRDAEEGTFTLAQAQLDTPAAPDVLTARQREVLRLVAGGKSTKEVAFFLNLSVKTVETHRAQIMERLGIRDVPGLVRYALRTGLVPPDG